MSPQRLLAHFDRISDAPDAIPRLRQLILELAVRGKLVPQDSEEGSAKTLAELIATEKARRIKAGKIKNRIPELPFSKAELPIEVPKNWVWLRLGEIGKLAGGMTPSMNRPDFWGGSIPWLSPKDIKADELFDSEMKITDLGLSETRLEAYSPGSLFMVARSGILKRTFPVAINRIPATANQDMKVLVPFLGGQERYLQIMFRGLSQFILTELVKTGTTVQSLKYAEFEEQPFPLPPLAEQKRIVAKVDELMALCDQLEAAKAEKEKTRDRLTSATLARLNAPAVEASEFTDHARFALDNLASITTRPEQVKQIRQTILNLAVRGKLVKQDPKDEPVTELLKRVQIERAKRILKRGEKTLSPPSQVPTDSVEFELPKGWLWVCLGEVIKLWNGYAFRSSDFQPDGIPVIRIGDLKCGEVSLSHAVCVSEKVAESVNKEVWIPSGALLIAMSGATTGKIAVNKTFGRLLLNQRVGRIEEFVISRSFVRLFFETIVSRNLAISFGTAIPNLSSQQINETPIPLPPLAEQHRIVAKVDELMVLCDQLEAALMTRQTESLRLLEAMLHEALPKNQSDER